MKVYLKYTFCLLLVFVLGSLTLVSNETYAQTKSRKASSAGASCLLSSSKVLVSRNGKDNAGEVGVFNNTLDSNLGKVIVGNNEGIALNSRGNLYQCGDGSNGPSVRVFARFGQRTDKTGVEFDAKRDREIKGDSTTLKNPKGLDIDDEHGLLFVAENGNGTVLVFSSEASGDVAPLATITTSAKPWDVEYDEASDTLYVALVNGEVAVYNSFYSSGFDTNLDRTIKPEGSVNLHGIVYVPGKDLLLLSDVGDAKSNSDGKLFVIKRASKANGTVRPARTIQGDATKLGNPVDIIYDGRDLYVAEKANDVLLVYRNIAIGSNGNIPANVTVSDTKPEALVILR